MYPHEHAQQPSGLPTAGSQPPAYDPNQGYAPAYDPAPPYAPPAVSYEHAQPTAYGYDQAPPTAYAYEQTPPATNGYEPVYQQAAPPPAYQQAPAPPAYQAPGPPEYQPNPGYQQQPPAAAGYPQTPPPPPPGWGVPPDGPRPYIITPGAQPVVTKKAGVGRRIALIGVVALLLVGGGGAFAADAWAKGQVCDAVQDLDKDTASSGKNSKSSNDAPPTVAEIDDAEKALNSRADLLFFHGDLKEATHELADDFESMKPLLTKDLDHPDAKTVTQLLALVASLDSHARKAQRACGLPEKSLMGTTA